MAGGLAVPIHHKRLNPAGGIDFEPAHTIGPCCPYVDEREGKIYLRVIEGAAYHTFEISPAGLGRLGADVAELLWKRERARVMG